MHLTVLNQLATRLGYKNQDSVKEAKARAEKLGLSEELLDSFYLLTDLPENEAKERLRQVGLDGEILNDLFPLYEYSSETEIVTPLPFLNSSEVILFEKSPPDHTCVPNTLSLSFT